MKHENRILSLLRAGVPPKEIRVKLRVLGCAITAIKKKHGITLSPRGRPISNPEIAKMLAQGKSTLEIMKSFPTASHSTISFARKKIGLNPARRRKCKMEVGELRRLKHSGMSYKEVAEAAGGFVTQQRIQQLITSRPKAGRGKCAHCRKRRKLIRHHTNYLKDEVVHICGSCHSRLHNIGNKNGKSKFNIDEYFTNVYKVDNANIVKKFICSKSPSRKLKP